LSFYNEIITECKEFFLFLCCQRKKYVNVKFASDEDEKPWDKSVPILHATAPKKELTYL